MRSNEHTAVRSLDQQAVQLNIALLVIHAVLLVIYCVLRMAVPAIVGGAGALLYLFMLLSVTRQRPVWLLTVSIIEISFQMGFSAFALGWGCGFQLYCFALIPIIFFCDYLRPKAGRRSPVSAVLSVCAAAFFCLLRLLCVRYQPLYEVGSTAASAFFFFNALVVFFFITVYMCRFKNLVLHTEGSLSRAAAYDGLTQLRNHNSMQQLLDRTFSLCCRRHSSMSVVILDIDDFKQINDQYGHNAGDYILRSISRIIRSCESDGAIKASRWGGEEFVLMAVGTDSAARLNKEVSRLIRIIGSRAYWYDDQRITVTMTAGMAAYRNDDSVDSLLARADQCLYQGKARGKNQLVAVI
jgi:diguanylate cyclase (GGDEF)-like protein